ncbi:MAG: hypothetical protein H6812_03600 [Phycisphaeraceae bacterium]|nr:hypothetical protein [Phycisphaerales bacterium]MCB9842322.1 hypothetical protein [Phycisphaeraceae bacterium]
MVDPNPPDRLPRNILPIVVSTAIACLGYVLFTMRFGAPLRSADTALERYRQMEINLPDRIEAGIDKQVGNSLRVIQGEIEAMRRASANGPSNPLDSRVKTLEARVKQLTDDLEQAQRLVAAASNAAANAQRSVSRLQEGTIGYAEAGEVIRVPTPADDEPPAPAILATPQRAPANSLPRLDHQTTLVDHARDIVCTITDTRLTSDGLIIEFTLGNEAADQEVWLRAPNGNGTRSTKTRVFTADGLTLQDGGVKRRGQRYWQEGMLRADLAEGIPLAFEALFRGKFGEALDCPRIEVEVSLTEKKDDLIVFRFENITAEQ